MGRAWKRASVGAIDDRELAGYLAGQVFLEIRIVAGQRRRLQDVPPAEAVAGISGWAGFGRNLLGISQSGSWQPSRGFLTRREQAMRKRPLSYEWEINGPERQQWILRHIEQAGFQWTPPPPLPTNRRGVPELTLRQRLGVLRGWPVRTPKGKQPLPRQARVLKELDREGIFALYQEAGHLRLGRGKGNPWLYAHLDPQGPHFLFPDPPSYEWPNAERRQWLCGVLLRMIDGEQVGGSLAVMPETFTALPSTVPRLQQLRLATVARAMEWDGYLWSREHKPNCGPSSCGFESTKA
jgi:hypothetical protein